MVREGGREMIKTIDIILILAFGVAANDVCTNSYVDIRNIVTSMGWTVTSEMGGGHNAHSRHYVGKAIDVRTRGKNEFDIAILFTVLQEEGYTVIDERVRPKGQRVWKGSHVHIQVPYCE
jgi:hypothetical protein